MSGTYGQIGGGQLETAYASILRAGAGEEWSYKVSASYFQQDEPYDRPTGLIPGTSTPYPDFENSGTTQPKIDLRFDRDTSDDTTWSFSAGWATTDGLVHTGIGPFDVNSDSSLAYAKASWRKQALTVSAFINKLDGDASNLLTVGPDGQPLLLGFQSDTYNLDITNTGVIGNSHILTYGANARHNNYDLTIAPSGSDRDEVGVFLQDEILFGDKVRWVVGARWDDIDPIGNVVSPRTTLMFSPKPNSTFRISYNRAFRAPSLIENYLDIVIVNQVLLPAFPPLLPNPSLYVFPTAALGNPELGEEQLDAYEIGYVGTFKKVNFTFAVYRNETTDATDFFEAAFYDSNNPPPGWPLPPFIPIGPGIFLPTVPTNTFPSVFTYRNIGEIVNQGAEISVDVRPTKAWRINANYTYQEDPDPTGIDESEINKPPRHRFNFGVAYDAERWYINANMNYQDEAFWTDVLDSRFHGPTDSFTQVNLGIGFRFGDRATLTLTGSNIFDEEVQQHVFGDIISRKVTAELRFNF
jgi:outer membrane receptor protein involved in Fe transport